LFAALSPAMSLAGEWFIDGGPRVSETFDIYVRIRVLAAPLSLMNYAILGYVLGRGEGSLGLLLQIILNGCNITLCIILGLELGWGVAGVAWATVIGEAIAMLIGLAIVARRLRASPRPPPRRPFP